MAEGPYLAFAKDWERDAATPVIAWAADGGNAYLASSIRLSNFEGKPSATFVDGEAVQRS